MFQRHVDLCRAVDDVRIHGAETNQHRALTCMRSASTPLSSIWDTPAPEKRRRRETGPLLLGKVYRGPRVVSIEEAPHSDAQRKWRYGKTRRGNGKDGSSEWLSASRQLEYQASRRTPRQPSYVLGFLNCLQQSIRIYPVVLYKLKFQVTCSSEQGLLQNKIQHKVN